MIISQAMGKPWDEVLQPATSSYNGKIHGATGVAPQMLFALREPKEDDVEEVARLLAIEDAKASIKMNQKIYVGEFCCMLTSMHMLTNHAYRSESIIEGTSL